ncbi:hypothetical protein BDV19DRAFT_394218 [Aspergillus venezuelensis]
MKTSTLPILGAIGYAAALPASLREEDNQSSDASPAVNPVYPSFSGSQPSFTFGGGVKPFFPGYTGNTGMAAPASQGVFGVGAGVGAFPSLGLGQSVPSTSTGATETDGAAGASTPTSTSPAPELAFSEFPGAFPAPTPAASWSGLGFGNFGGFSGFPGFGAPASTTSTTAFQAAAASASPAQTAAASGAAGATGDGNVIPGFGTTIPEREDDGEVEGEKEEEKEEKEKGEEQEE